MYKNWNEAIKGLELHELLVTYVIDKKDKEVTEYFKSIEDFKNYAYMMGYSYKKVYNKTTGVTYYPKIKSA